MNNYLVILEDSLKKKNIVLDDILKCMDEQDELLRQEKLSLEAFDLCMEEKDQLIQRLELLDSGFENVYDRVKLQLEQDKNLYSEQIKNMQELIALITEKVATIQAKEQRSKNMLNMQLSKMRANIQNGRRNSTAIYNRYHNLNGVVDAQFLDWKQ